MVGVDAETGSSIKRFLRFCLIGATGFVIDNLVLFVLVDCFEGPIVGSKVVAAVTAMVNNFVWNDRWTFRDMGGDRFDRLLEGQNRHPGERQLPLSGKIADRVDMSLLKLLLVYHFPYRSQ